MIIKVVMVTSVDGRSTFHSGESPVSSWTSAEDQSHFAAFIRDAEVIVMGRRTYESAKPFIKNDGKYRIVMSREKHSPKAVVEDLMKRGYAEVLLVGGSELNAAFFREHYVNEIYLTLEPKIFGSGLPLAKDFGEQASLQLLEVTRLNSRGTLLLHYRVL